MKTLVPNRFLFTFEFPLAYRAKLPALNGSLSGWSDAELLPELGEIDGRRDFADVWACWNESGMAIAAQVAGKRKALRCDPLRFWEGDNLRLCTHTRDARDVKRATRYCQQFFLLPTGAGRAKDQPAAGIGQFQRAKENAPRVPVERIRVSAEVTKAGYNLEGFVPAECLVGFDPEQHPRIGFYYMLEDADHGQQYLTVGDDLGWNVDPSTWATAVLAR